MPEGARKAQTPLFGESMTDEEIAARVPNLDALAGVRHLRVGEGPARGTPIIEVHNGGGLVIELLPDRCCDLGTVWCRGIPFGWTGPAGLPSPALTRNMDRALGGLLATCGFDHVRQDETDGALAYPLHGSMALQPARVLSATRRWCGASRAVVVEAEVTRFSLKEGGMRLRRRIVVPVGGTGLRIEDEVVPLVAPAPVMALYHVNLGHPLIAEDTACRVSGASDGDGERTVPLDRAGVAVLPLAHGPARIAVVRETAGLHAGLVLSFDGAALPYLQTYRRPEPGLNLFCLEPVTHDRLPRAELRRRGALVAQPAGTPLSFSLTLTFNGELRRPDGAERDPA